MYVSKKYALQDLFKTLSTSDEALSNAVGHLELWAGKRWIALVPESKEEMREALNSAVTDAISFYQSSKSYENEDLVRDSILRKNIVRNFLEIVAVPLKLDEKVIRMRSSSSRFTKFRKEPKGYDKLLKTFYETYGSFDVEPNPQNFWLYRRAADRLIRQTYKANQSNSFERDMEVAKALGALGTDAGKHLSRFVEQTASMTGFNYAFAYSCLSYLYLSGVEVLDATYIVKGIMERVGVSADLTTLVKTFIEEIIEPNGLSRFTDIYYEMVKFDVKRFNAVDFDSDKFVNLFRKVFVNPRDSLGFISYLLRNYRVITSSNTLYDFSSDMNPIADLMKMALE